MPIARFDDDLPDRNKPPSPEVLPPPKQAPNRVRRPLRPNPDFACIICGCAIDLPTAWFVAGVALCPSCRRTCRAEKILAYVHAFCTVPVMSVHSSHHGLLFWRPPGEIVTDNILSWMTLLPGNLAWDLLAIESFRYPEPDRIDPDVTLDQTLACQSASRLPDQPISDTLPV